MNLHDWIDEVCDSLDIEAEIDEGLVLDLTKTVADNVQRPAAPVTAYLLGYAAGVTDSDPDGVERLAARVQTLAEGWDRPADVRAPEPRAADDDSEDDVPEDVMHDFEEELEDAEVD
ncbi:DUF6457 domain-containing protein [Nocardioides cheoyonin]|uniref:DUF6457 domain-containing protein n=1 Tax=Nocardioides cheoyonin TaxID=3156615 RepID=UPI0032B5CD73